MKRDIICVCGQGKGTGSLGLLCMRSPCFMEHSRTVGQICHLVEGWKGVPSKQRTWIGIDTKGVYSGI